MEVAWRRQRKYLVANIDCSGGPRRLQGGGAGWYEVEVQPWLCDWKLRVSVSITQIGRCDPYPLDAGNAPQERTQARRFLPDNEWMDVLVDGEVLEVWFPVPDCIQRFQNTHSFGCSGRATIIMGTGVYHCGARLVAENRDYLASLRRTGKTIEFIRTDLGRATVVGSIDDWRLPFDLEALFQGVRQDRNNT